MPPTETGEPPRAKPAAASNEPAWLRYEATIALRLIVLAAAFVFATWLVMRVQLVAVAAFIGFAQVALLWPLVRPLRSFMPHVVAALLAVVVYLAVFGGVLWFVVLGLVNTWPDLVEAVVGGAQALEQGAREAGWELPQSAVEGLIDEVRQRAGMIAGGIGSATVTTLSAASSLATIVLIAIFLTIFALTSGPDLWQLILRVFPRRRHGQADASFRRGLHTARWWMLASTVTGLVDGVFIGGGLWLMGVPLAIPIGAATFVLGYIPMVGATLAGAVAVIVALFFGGIQTAVWALLLVLAVQQIEGNVLSPLLLSRAVSFHPVFTLLLSTAGGLAFGIVGLFLAVPVAGILFALVVTWRRYGQDDEESPPSPDDGDSAGAPDEPDGTTTREPAPQDSRTARSE